MRRLFFIFILLAGTSLVQAQVDLPNPIQIDRLIVVRSNTDARLLRWIEVRELRNGDARSWSMVDAHSSELGVESACYQAAAIGSAPPIYLIDDEQQAVDSADTLWQQFENRRIVDQSRLFAEGTACVVGETDIINGVSAQSCTFTNVDAAHLFLIHPPATSTGVLWRAVEGGYPVRYTFDAQGSAESVSHQFDVSQPGEILITPPGETTLMCFEGNFPIPNQAVPVGRPSISYAAFSSVMSSEQLRLYYDTALLPTWQIESQDINGNQIYTRTLENGTQCRLSLRYRQRGDRTDYSAEVYPTFVDVERLELPEGFPELTVIQSAFRATLRTTDSPRLAAERLSSEQQANGWTLRPELTDIRENSAFVTLVRDSYERYIIVGETASGSDILIDSRPATCIN